MDIKKTEHVQQILGMGKKKMEPVQEASKDSLNISNHAKQLAEVNVYKKLILSTPDVREGLVQEVKAKLENGFYMDNKINAILADSLSKFLSTNEEF